MTDEDSRSVDLVRRTAKIISEDLGGWPTAAELVEVLGTAVPTPEPAFEDPGVRPVFTPAGSQSGSPSRVAELGDVVFAEVAGLQSRYLRDLAAEIGRPVTVAELAETLTEGLTAFLRDTTNQTSGMILRPAPPPKVRRVRRGDVIAIPCAAGFRIGIVLGHSRFGTALGLFQGVVTVARLPPRPPESVVPYAVHTDPNAILTGRWPIVGHDESLADALPEPEIYHELGLSGLDPAVYPYGAAETATGRLRAITAEEARRVGLHDGSYEQACLSEDLQDGIGRIV